MRVLPPFAPFLGLLGGVLIALSAMFALPGEWIAYSSPRAAAEDAVAQAQLLPYQMAASEGLSAFDDAGCPMSAVLGWNRLVESAGAWQIFTWLLGYSARPAGRLLALAGLEAIDSARFRNEHADLIERAKVGDSVQVVFGWVEVVGKEPIAWLSSDSVLSALKAGAIGRDLRAIRPQRGCSRGSV